MNGISQSENFIVTNIKQKKALSRAVMVPRQGTGFTTASRVEIIMANLPYAFATVTTPPARL